MNKILPLHPSIVAKIAAGEVIERPAYAVKELLENAIDSGATSIRIDIQKSGLEKILVSDNGEGMSKEDLLASFQSHTTSKIFSKEDLTAIRYLGFRGEALSSIAAISTFSIKSRLASSPIGTEVVVEAGNVLKSAPVGMSPGTTVVVEELFRTVPARKKFLKSLPTEFRYVLQIISQYAIAFPNIHFYVTHNKKTVLNVPENQEISERVQEVLGNDLYENIVPFLHDTSPYAVSGFLSHPQFAQTSTQKQFIFINKRSIKNKMISSLIKNVYGTLLPAQCFPAFILFLKAPYDAVDVNVHPRKEEVSLHNEETVKELITAAVAQSLHTHNFTFHDKRWRKTEYRPQINKTSLVRDGSSTSYASQLLKEEKLSWQLPNKQAKITSDVYQLHNLYLVASSEDGIIVYDQHAVHERILYEQYEELFLKNRKITPSIVLKEPVQLQLSISDKEVLEEYKNEVEGMGFTLSASFKVTHAPELFKDRDIKELFVEILSDFEEDRLVSIDLRSKRMLAYMACRAAVKAGEKLTKEQCLQLIKQLEKVENAYTCPHGRPLKIEMKLEDLNKEFKRM
jgi:DNA mismatch repair protein MutL